VTLISEEINPVAIAIIELLLSEGISKSVSQSAENSVEKKIFLNFISPCWKGLWLI